MTLNSRKFRILWATEQHDNFLALFRSNKIGIFFLKLINQKAYCKIIGMYLDIQLQKEGHLSYKEEKLLTFLYKKNFLPKFLRLNEYAYSKKLFPSNEEIEISHQAFSIIQERVNFFSFENLIKEFSEANFALVGNAPICDQNHNRLQQKKIDSSDIVIRFNKFETNEFQEHIGTKCSWVAGICHNYTGLAPTFILTDNPLHEYLSIKTSKHIVETKLKNTYFISQAITNELGKELDYLPSSGLRIIYTFYKLNIKPDLFGFSYFNKAKASTNFEHYFETRNHKEHYHSMEKEKAFVQNLY